jgi:hypothetical protein
MSILNGDDPTDMSEVLESLETEGHNDHDSESTPMTHDQIVALLVQERDYYKEESHKDREALKTIMALCNQKGFDPFGEGSKPLPRRATDLSREELVARNEEATARIEKTRSVDSKDKIPMPTYEEQAKLYKENPNVTLFMELMEKSKMTESERIAKKEPKRPWWKFIFGSSSKPHDPYSDGHSSFGNRYED